MFKTRGKCPPQAPFFPRSGGRTRARVVPVSDIAHPSQHDLSLKNGLGPRLQRYRRLCRAWLRPGFPKSCIGFLVSVWPRTRRQFSIACDFWLALRSRYMCAACFLIRVRGRNASEQRHPVQGRARGEGPAAAAASSSPFFSFFARLPRDPRLFVSVRVRTSARTALDPRATRAQLAQDQRAIRTRPARDLRATRARNPGSARAIVRQIGGSLLDWGPGRDSRATNTGRDPLPMSASLVSRPTFTIAGWWQPI